MYITGFKAILVRKLLISITTITLQPGALRAGGRGGGGGYLTQKKIEVVFKKSIPTKKCQLLFYISDRKGQVDEFVREPTSAKRISKHFVRDKNWGGGEEVPGR